MNCPASTISLLYFYYTGNAGHKVRQCRTGLQALAIQRMKSGYGSAQLVTPDWK
jgi:hypothetical protein